MTGGARPRRKGDRIEREIVELHQRLGIKAERYPLSGASRFRGSGHDIDLYLFGAEAAPAVAEVKGRKHGKGFTQLEKWMGDYDVLILKRNNADPMVLLPWRTWGRLLTEGRPWHERASPKRSGQPRAKTSARRGRNGDAANAEAG